MKNVYIIDFRREILLLIALLSPAGQLSGSATEQLPGSFLQETSTWQTLEPKSFKFRKISFSRCHPAVLYVSVWLWTDLYWRPKNDTDFHRPITVNNPVRTEIVQKCLVLMFPAVHILTVILDFWNEKYFSKKEVSVQEISAFEHN